MKELLVCLLAIAAGIFCIWAAVANKDFFFENYRARGIVRLFGRTGARIFYVLLGAGICVCTLMIIFHR